MTPEPVTLRLGEGGKPSSVKFDVFGFTLDVQVPEDGIPIHARKPLALGGVYDPDPRVRLHWQTTPQFSVETHADHPPRVVVDLVTVVSCEDVGLSTDPFPLRELPKGRSRNAITTTETPLSATPEGPAVAELPRGASVSVYRVAHGHAEIVYENLGRWHGWVPDSLLQAGPAGKWGHGSGTGHRSEEAFPGFRCPSDLPLYLGRFDQIEPLIQVGVVRAHAHVTFGGELGSYRPLFDEQRTSTNELGKLSLEPGFMLEVDAVASRECVME